MTRSTAHTAVHHPVLGLFAFFMFVVPVAAWKMTKWSGLAIWALLKWTGIVYWYATKWTIIVPVVAVAQLLRRRAAAGNAEPATERMAHAW